MSKYEDQQRRRKERERRRREEEAKKPPKPSKEPEKEPEEAEKSGDGNPFLLKYSWLPTYSLEDGPEEIRDANNPDPT